LRKVLWLVLAGKVVVRRLLFENRLGARRPLL
jgi:hypothetical protein